MKTTGMLAVLLPLLLWAVSCAPPEPEKVVVEPALIDSVLVNPGMGFTTFYSFNSDEINDNYPECSIAYFRWYWVVLEPREGEYNFAMIDSILELCSADNQKLAFRVMCQNGHEMADKGGTQRFEVPDWYIESGATGWYYGDGGHWQPNYDDPMFLRRHGALIRALGDRYDGHPLVDHVDIGSLGRWGEWHTEGLELPMPSPEVKKRIVDLYVESFRETPLVMQIDGGDAAGYAVARGTGWRADCLGDLSENRFFDAAGNEENHMEDRYPRAISRQRLDRGWKNGPVALETCWNMQEWRQRGWDVDWIFSRALEWHVSVLNNKSFDVPEEWWPQVRELQKKMGYRLALRRLEHPSSVERGSPLELDMLWENLGVAPPYHGYDLEFRLRSAEGVGDFAFHSSADVRKWTPGGHKLIYYGEIGEEMEPGYYDLLVGLLDRHTGEPAIRLAIGGRRPDGWYTISRLRIE